MNIDKHLLDDLTASEEMHIVARTLATFSLKRNAYDDFRRNPDFLGHYWLKTYLFRRNLLISKYLANFCLYLPKILLYEV